MKTYKVTMNQTVARDYIVEATTKQEARDVTEKMYLENDENYGETFTTWNFVETEQIGN